MNIYESRISRTSLTIQYQLTNYEIITKIDLYVIYSVIQNVKELKYSK